MHLIFVPCRLIWFVQLRALRHGFKSWSEHHKPLLIYPLLCSPFKSLAGNIVFTLVHEGFFSLLFFRWEGLKDFNSIDRTPLYCTTEEPGVTKGFLKSYKNLHFYWILKAGHFVSLLYFYYFYLIFRLSSQHIWNFLSQNFGNGIWHNNLYLFVYITSGTFTLT